MAVLLALVVVQAAAAAASSSSFSVGIFRVTVSDSSAIAVSSAGGHAVWGTGELPWLATATGKWTVEDGEGMVVVDLPDDHDRCKTTVQTIGPGELTPGGSLRFAGNLSLHKTARTLGCPAAASSGISYSVVFSIAPESPNQLRIAFTTGADDSSKDSSTAGVGGRSQAYREVEVVMASAAAERVYGLGVQYSAFNLKGRVVPVITSEQGVGRGLKPITTVLGKSAGNWHTTYSAIPHLITSRNRSLWLEGSDYSIFDFTQSDTYAARIFAGAATLRVTAATDPLGLVEEYTVYAGRMPPLPDWIMQGPVVGYEGGTANVSAMHARFIAANVTPAAFWVQDWTGLRTDKFGTRLWWNWELDTDHYPHFDQLCTNLSRTGTYLMTYVNPFLANTVTADKPNFNRDLFKEAAAAGYLVTDHTGKPYIMSSASPTFTFGMVDFSNPTAKLWFTDLIAHNMLGTGQRGWMADFAEYLPFDATLHAGTAAQQHNVYPQQWAEVNHNAVTNVTSPGVFDDAVFFMRSSHTKSPSYSTLFWLGDQLVTWDAYDGLATTIIGHLSSGLSGLSLTHSDIGGYTMVDTAVLKYIRSKELLIRWTEMSAISDAVMRSHPGNLPQNSWQLYSDAATLKCFGRLVSLHKALLPYRTLLMHAAATRGHPLVRPLWFHFPADGQAFTITTQFLLGPDLLAAPVLAPNASAVEVYLPGTPGGWVNVWTAEVVGGSGVAIQQASVKAPMGTPPLFARAGSDIAATLPAALKHIAPADVCL